MLKRTRIFPTLLLMFALSACTQSMPRAQSVEDMIAVTAAHIEAAADQVREACGHDVAGAPCQAGAIIDTDTRDKLKARLQEAVDGLQLATLAVAADKSYDASNYLGRAQTLLNLVRTELARRQNE